MNTQQKKVLMAVVAIIFFLAPILRSFQTLVVAVQSGVTWKITFAGWAFILFVALPFVTVFVGKAMKNQE